MDYEILYLIILVFSVTVIVTTGLTNHHAQSMKCFNSSYDRNSKDSISVPDLKEPLFYVDKIELIYTSNGMKRIAKYTCYVTFLNGKNSSQLNRFVFYGPIDKYKIGDQLQLSLKNYNYD